MFSVFATLSHDQRVASPRVCTLIRTNIALDQCLKEGVVPVYRLTPPLGRVTELHFGPHDLNTCRPVSAVKICYTAAGGASQLTRIKLDTSASRLTAVLFTPAFMHRKGFPDQFFWLGSFLSTPCLKRVTRIDLSM